MALIKPFAALRPRPDEAERICELPYDVLSTAEARVAATGNPLSFFHVSKPEIDLPPDTDVHAPEVYAKAKSNFQEFISRGALCRDDAPHFYLYRQVMNGHSQVGLVAVASCQEYLDGTIKKHELTRPDKEDDRVRHIETLNSQTGPAFLTYRAVPAIDAFVARQTALQPDIDFTAKDGVRHSSWTIDQNDSGFLVSAFEKISSLYIADGHHRSAAGARVFQTRKGAGSSAFFLSVIFPDNQLQILPYNRVLKDLNALSEIELLKKLESVFVIKQPGSAKPRQLHELGLFVGNQWRTLTFRPEFVATTDPIEKLDVTLVQKHVLGPIFGVDNPRTSERIGFVGGIRGTAELEKLVQSGQYACAFAMFPTRIEDLMTVADAGGLMPPKSTWFEPKLRDAMFCHLIS
jgi:uncharacterized protein (DUF1015 family)